MNGDGGGGGGNDDVDAKRKYQSICLGNLTNWTDDKWM